MSASSETPEAAARRPKLATIWLGGCSGCHMSFLDLDERLLELVSKVDIVFSPIVDAKVFPEGVDVTLVEGAVANEEHLDFIREVREKSRILMSFGDCAVTGNVTAMRDPLERALPVLERSYLDPSNLHAKLPDDADIVPPLLDRVVPVHQVVEVDAYLPGCPPDADLIWYALGELLAGRPLDLSGRLHFG